MSRRWLYCAVLLICSTVALWSCHREKERLPFLNTELVEKEKDGHVITDTVPKVIPPFRFLNQDSVEITNNTFAGKIYVADFFFTTCPTICPVMHRNLKAVYEEFANQPDLLFLSHTIDFRYDRPSRLKAYSRKLDIDSSRWQFAWGSRDSVYMMAQKHYLVSVGEERNAPGGFVHQGYLILVDRKGRIRGAFDGTVGAEVDKLRAAIPVLLSEDSN